MPIRPSLFAFVLVLPAACSSPAEVAERTGADAGPTARATASASAASTAQGKARKDAEDTDLYSYEFSYPAAVGAIPTLAAKLEQDAAKARSELIAEATDAREMAKKDSYPFNPHSYGEEWKVVANLPGYLSLSNEFYTFTGGAHGMYGLEGYIWDKANNRGFPSAEIFTSPGYLQSQLGDRVCAALNAARVKKGMDPVSGTDPVFPACPGFDEATILVGSSNGKTFDRITVWYGPYVAGSYAEGAYELDFPMTPAMIEAVKPAYRAAFGAKR
jgi:hypothetical protein